MTTVRWKLAVLLVLGAAAACGSPKKANDPCLDESTIYEGLATDEVCLVLLDSADTATIGGVDAPALVVPTDGQTFAVTSSAITFSFTSPVDSDGNTARLEAPAPRASRWQRWRDSLSPVSTAWAHEPPVTGAIHMLRITGAAGREEGILLFTSKLQVTIAGDALARVLATAGPMEVELYSAYLTENRILNPASDGVFRAAEDRTFSIDP